MNESCLSDQVIEQLQAKRLPENMNEAEAHLATCERCQMRALSSASSAALAGGLHGIFSEQVSDHLTYPEAVAYVDGHLDELEREAAVLHIEVCVSCQAVVDGLVDADRIIAAAARDGDTAMTGAASARARSWRERLAGVLPRPRAEGSTSASSARGAAAAPARATSASGSSARDAAPAPAWAHALFLRLSLATAGCAAVALACLLLNASWRHRYTMLERQEQRDHGLLQSAIAGISRAKAGRGEEQLAMTLPTDLARIGDLPHVQRGSSRVPLEVTLMSPSGYAELDPQFEWRPYPRAVSYALTVFSADPASARSGPVFEKVVSYASSYTPEKPLDPGAWYHWQVAARFANQAAPEVRSATGTFKTMDTHHALALGIAYANAGLIDRARRSFIALLPYGTDGRRAGALLHQLPSNH